MLPAHQRVVLVSGANRGLGLAIARRLHAEGYRLSLGVRDPKRLPKDPPWDAAHTQVVAYEARERDAGAQWVEAAAKRFGRIDAIVNNASINRFVSVEEGDEAILDELWEVNVKGPFRLTRAAFPHLKATGSGRVLNIASLSSKRLKSASAGYPMTKFALLAMSHATRYAGWEAGVRATALCPGMMNTDMPGDDWPFPREQAIQPEDVASVVAALLTLPNTASVAEFPINCVLETVA